MSEGAECRPGRQCGRQASGSACGKPVGSDYRMCHQSRVELQSWGWWAALQSRAQPGEGFLALHVCLSREPGQNLGGAQTGGKRDDHSN